ncbi:MAG TPA: methyltransferase domain-containing protein [Terriglobia bacterium]|nr:methyltransferase domain-containing protein [Terriglobia bacterium]
MSKPAGLHRRRIVQEEFACISESYSRLAARRGAEREARAIAEWLRPRPGERVLDAACGPARLARALAPHVAEVHGLDLCPRMIEMARQLSRPNGARLFLTVGDVESLPYPRRGFDLVVSTYVFANLPDPLRVLEEFSRVLGRGGRVAIIDVVAPESQARRARLNHLEALRGRLPTRLLSASEFQRLFQQAGLRVESKRFQRRRSRFRDWLRLSPAAVRPGRAQTLRRMILESMEGGDAEFEVRRVAGELFLYHNTGWFLLRRGSR